MPETAEQTSELDKVHGWRLHVLVEAGYPVEVAERIAGSPVDLHESVKLLSQGCSPEVAEKILL